MNQVVAYVDGFNLYFGLKEGYGRRYHWLDLQALIANLQQAPGSPPTWMRWRVTAPWCA